MDLKKILLLAFFIIGCNEIKPIHATMHTDSYEGSWMMEEDYDIIEKTMIDDGNSIILKYYCYSDVRGNFVFDFYIPNANNLDDIYDNSTIEFSSIDSKGNKYELKSSMVNVLLENLQKLYNVELE